MPKAVTQGVGIQRYITHPYTLLTCCCMFPCAWYWMHTWKADVVPGVWWLRRYLYWYRNDVMITPYANRNRYTLVHGFCVGVSYGWQISVLLWDLLFANVVVLCRHGYLLGCKEVSSLLAGRSYRQSKINGNCNICNLGHGLAQTGEITSCYVSGAAVDK